MPSKIFKDAFPLDSHPSEPAVLKMVPGSKILKSGLQFLNNDRSRIPAVVVWFHQPVNGEGRSPAKVPVKFLSIGTGGDAPEGYTYIGTTQMDVNGTEIVQHQYVESTAPVSIIGR